MNFLNNQESELNILPMHELLTSQNKRQSMNMDRKVDKVEEKI